MWPNSWRSSEMFLASLGWIKIPTPGMATAARCFNSPMVLVKQDTPKKLPIYLPRPIQGTTLRMADLMVSFGIDSSGKGFNEPMLRNFKALTFNPITRWWIPLVTLSAVLRVVIPVCVKIPQCHWGDFPQSSTGETKWKEKLKGVQTNNVRLTLYLSWLCCRVFLEYFFRESCNDW